MRAQEASRPGRTLRPIWGGGGKSGGSGRAGSCLRSGFLSSEDGLRISWRAVGSGPPIVCCNGIGVASSWWRCFVDSFCQRHRMIVWDYPGHGLSEAPREPRSADLSIGRLSRDLARVIGHCCTEKPVIAGHSMGC